MEEFDDKLPKRRFDNFQFVPFHDIMQKAENREVTFRYWGMHCFVSYCYSVNALQEIPDQVIPTILLFWLLEVSLY
jgi:hypothetical protein